MKKQKFEKKTFIISNKEKIVLHFYEDRKLSVADSSEWGFLGLGSINVDKLFYGFKKPEQIIFHELWHYKNNLCFEIKYRIIKSWLIFLFFIVKPISYAQEFETDKYAVIRNGKSPTLQMLYGLDFYF